MRSEIIAVGSELLLGQIVNTNAQFISQKLAENGINVFFHTVVGDNYVRLQQALQVAETRSEIIIITGGLGPTTDDLTKEAVSEHLGVALVEDSGSMNNMVELYKTNKRDVTNGDRKQVLVLQGSTVLPNACGLAPGCVITIKNHTYVLLPGPPIELFPMFSDLTIPILKKHLPTTDVIFSRRLHLFGVNEAFIEEKLSHLFRKRGNVTVAPLATIGEVELRITAKLDSKFAAKAICDTIVEEIRLVVGEFIYGEGETSLLELCIETLRKSKKTIAVAESLTGGLFQQELTSLSGISEIYSGGVVVYSKETKEEILGVRKETIESYGVVSSQCAMEMAVKVREKFKTSVGISFTGVAGPIELENKPVGTAFVGYAFDNGTCHVEEYHLGNERTYNRIKLIKNAYHFLWKKFITK